MRNTYYQEQTDPHTPTCPYITHAGHVPLLEAPYSFEKPSDVFQRFQAQPGQDHQMDQCRVESLDIFIADSVIYR